MQILVGKRMKILSESKVSAQVFSYIFGLTSSAYWRFDFFHIFSLRSHTSLMWESDSAKGMFATRHRNTCPHSLPIAHQTHRPVDGWRLDCRLRQPNSSRRATETITHSCVPAPIKAGSLTVFCPEAHSEDNNATTRLWFLPLWCIYSSFLTMIPLNALQL